jgi:hypothetical protein
MAQVRKKRKHAGDVSEDGKTAEVHVRVPRACSKVPEKAGWRSATNEE